MSLSSGLIKPPSQEYDDDILFGLRREANKLTEKERLESCPDCVTFGTFVDKHGWNLAKLVGGDRRLKDMMSGLRIEHALPIQRNCWPQMGRAMFSFVCIGPESSGKTFAHLLYIVSKCITAIPIAKTNEILMGDQSSSFQPDSSDPNHAARHNGMDLINVDQDNFDFNLLGRQQTTTPTTTTPQEAEQTQELDNGSSQPDDQHYEVDPDNFITHPRYIIVCSSQQHSDRVEAHIAAMKSAAFGPKAHLKRMNLPPIVRTIDVYHDDEKVALRWTESEILIATPTSLTRCIQLDYLDFEKCKMLIFDDIDLALQLHNANVRLIVKEYLKQTRVLTEHERQDICQLYLFSRKWTDLVQQFSHSVFEHRILIFGSMLEAALHANLRFELETYTDPKCKLQKLVNLIRLNLDENDQSKNTGAKIAIVNRSDEHSKLLSNRLEALGIQTKLIDSENSHSFKFNKLSNTKSTCIYVLSDKAIEFVVDDIKDITHIIHYAMPKEMLALDQRFRLMRYHIENSRKNLITTIFLSPQMKSAQVKCLHDIISRSNSTLKSTILELKDYICEKSKTICWRWATTGLCRLEKLSRNDKLGSYCADRHPTDLNDKSSSQADCRWPKDGQIKITITNLVSPNEFYFWFEAHRSISSQKWTPIGESGREFMAELQMKLDRLRDAPSCSVPLKDLRKGRIFGIYLQQEERVDRVMLLEDGFREDTDKENEKENWKPQNGLMNNLERIRAGEIYSNQCEVFQIDYGIRINVYLRNLLPLPDQIKSIEPQCHRAFLLGVKPSNNEPNWLYKAKKLFYESICVNNLQEITVWLRSNSNNCFWFENLVIYRHLTEDDGRVKYFQSEPLSQLCIAQFADRVSDPPFLKPSTRLQTQSKWHIDESAELAQFAFLRSDKNYLNIYVLHVDDKSLDLKVRQTDYNKHLIELEDRMLEDYRAERLQPLNYLAKDTYCVARVLEKHDKETGQPIYTINRCRIIDCLSNEKVAAKPQDKTFRYLLECLDHGDVFELGPDDLYLAAQDYLSQLPFQAIRARQAGLNLDLIKDPNLAYECSELIYDYTRDASNNLLKLKCKLGADGTLYIYVPIGEKTYRPLISLFEVNNKIELCRDGREEMRQDLVDEEPDSCPAGDTLELIKDEFLCVVIADILRDIVEEELMDE